MNISKTMQAALNADWQQVVLNGGPPCFHFDEDRGLFCLRAERWQGHSDTKAEFPYHKFVPLANLITSLERENAELRQWKMEQQQSLIAMAVELVGTKGPGVLDGIMELKTKLAYAEDAAAKGEKARQVAEMENAELRDHLIKMIYWAESITISMKSSDRWHEDIRRARAILTKPEPQ